MYEDNDQSRLECLYVVNTIMRHANHLSHETIGTKNLIYYTAFFDNGYIELLNNSIISIVNNSDINFDVLIITDEQTKSVIEQQPFNSFIKPKYLILDTPVDGIEASQHKISVYKYEHISNYDKILFIDCDVVCISDVNVIFAHELKHNTLYTARNLNIDYSYHKTLYHGFEFLGDEYVNNMTLKQQKPFNTGQFLFKNSKAMQQHFKNIRWFMVFWTGTYFFEQCFMNYYFCTAAIADDSVLQTHMGIISTVDNEIKFNITSDVCLLHFIAPPLDATVKLKFINSLNLLK